MTFNTSFQKSWQGSQLTSPVNTGTRDDKQKTDLKEISQSTKNNKWEPSGCPMKCKTSSGKTSPNSIRLGRKLGHEEKWGIQEQNKENWTFVTKWKQARWSPENPGKKWTWHTTIVQFKSNCKKQHNMYFKLNTRLQPDRPQVILKNIAPCSLSGLLTPTCLAPSRGIMLPRRFGLHGCSWVALKK